MRKLDFQDLALRVLIVAAGTLSAVMFVLRGQAEVLPALAVGAILGAVVMGRTGASEE